MKEAANVDVSEIEVTLDMIKAGVDLYFAFDYEEDEPETLVAEILLTARDMQRGKIKREI